MIQAHCKSLGPSSRARALHALQGWVAASAPLKCDTSWIRWRDGLKAQFPTPSMRVYTRNPLERVWPFAGRQLRVAQGKAVDDCAFAIQFDDAARRDGRIDKSDCGTSGYAGAFVPEAAYVSREMDTAYDPEARWCSQQQGSNNGRRARQRPHPPDSR
jgi:hypothetical protein